MRGPLTRLSGSAPVRALGGANLLGLLVVVMGLFELSVTVATLLHGWLGVALGLLSVGAAVAVVVLRAWARKAGEAESAARRRRAG